MKNTYRQFLKSCSNNPQDPNKNKCTLAVCNALGVGGATRYLHNKSDVLRAARTAYSVRSVKSKLGKNPTVGKARKKLKDINGPFAFICFVKGHVMLIGAKGMTLVDTDPRKRDNRPVQAIYGVYKKI